MRDPRALLQPLLELHGRVRDEVMAATARQEIDVLAAVDRDAEGDTIYAIDVVAETVIARCAETLAREHSFVLVAEGLEGGSRCYPEGKESSADWRIIIDPIDGTRGLMYQKRSAWVLAAVAPNRGPATSLRDVVLAVQTEVPLLKQHLSDQLWAVRGEGVRTYRCNRLTGEQVPIRLRPSSAPGIAHGYASIARFFPGGRDELAAIDEAIVLGALGRPAAGKAHCFEDQYASTGGQLYELIAGHDRFVADLRPLLRPVLAGRGLPPALTCHPYDICTALIAEESGVIVTDPQGRALDVPLSVEDEVAWAGYANARIRARIEPLLQDALRARGWIPGGPDRLRALRVGESAAASAEAEGPPLPTESAVETSPDGKRGN
jgi:fructose-1,6-bisphosphatase/inositol monophosphatase family enzyme